MKDIVLKKKDELYFYNDELYTGIAYSPREGDNAQFLFVEKGYAEMVSPTKEVLEYKIVNGIIIYKKAFFVTVTVVATAAIVLAPLYAKENALFDIALMVTFISIFVVFLELEIRDITSRNWKIRLIPILCELICISVFVYRFTDFIK